MDAPALALDGADPQEALNAPRFCLPAGTAQSALSLEPGHAQHVDAMRARGHDVAVVDGWERAVFGRGQIIRREADGSWTGGSDPRADGCVGVTEGGEHRG